MKKIVLLSTLSASILLGQTQIKFTPVYTDYINSKTKIDGKGYELGLDHDFSLGKFAIGYDHSNVDRTGSNPSLEVEKLNLKYTHKFTQEAHAKLSYLSIDDNIAPTDNGKIYGLGGSYQLAQGVGIAADIYKSNYKQFDVNQLDITVSKNFTINKINSKFILGIKKIRIDGDKYANYTLKDKDYTTTSLALMSSFNGYQASIGTLIGKRLFGVLEEGTKVQHHAVEQDKTYFVGFGKKVGNLNIVAKYSYQNGIELPENQKDVDTKTTSLGIVYSF